MRSRAYLSGRLRLLLQHQSEQSLKVVLVAKERAHRISSATAHMGDGIAIADGSWKLSLPVGMAVATEAPRMRSVAGAGLSPVAKRIEWWWGGRTHRQESQDDDTCEQASTVMRTITTSGGLGWAEMNGLVWGWDGTAQGGLAGSGWGGMGWSVIRWVGMGWSELG